jgi:hypothetical protein
LFGSFKRKEIRSFFLFLSLKRKKRKKIFLLKYPKTCNTIEEARAKYLIIYIYKRRRLSIKKINNLIHFSPRVPRKDYWGWSDLPSSHFSPFLLLKNFPINRREEFSLQIISFLSVFELPNYP